MCQHSGHGISFYIFVLSSISFINVLQFSEYRLFTSLVKFIPQFYFYVIVNGIFFSVSLSDSPLFMYRKATDFCILILCPATLVNSLITSNSFLVASLRFFIYSAYLQTVTVLLLPFQFEFLLFLFLL